MDQDAIRTELAFIRDQVADVRTTLSKVGEAVVALARLEERQAELRDGLGRAFKSIDDHEGRIGEVEKKVPPLVESRNLVMRGMIGLVALVLVGAIFGGKVDVHLNAPPAITGK